MKSFAILSKRSHILLILIWFLNDFIFKTYLPGFVSGKISDLVGLYLSPLLLTAVFSILFKFNDEILIFKIISFIVFIFFVSVNISQDFSNYFYKLIDPGFGYSGFADLTDLFCLPIILLAYYKLNSSENTHRVNFKNYLVLLFAAFTFINSPSEPRGRSDAFSIILLLSGAEDAVYLLNPVNGKKVESNENFQFNFVGRNNESSPITLEKLPNPPECGPINETPILIDSGNSTGTSSYLNMLFLKYRINFYKDKKYNKYDFSILCDKDKCILDKEIKGNGEYFWDVSLQYRFIRDCKLYETFLKPKQKLENFNY